MNYRQEYEKWLASPALSEDERNELKAIANDEKEIENRFYGPLEFGTAGLRGTMYVGLHNMNRHVIRWATQGFANVIRAEGEEAMKKGVAICMDCRNHSMEFARAAACVMAGNGINVKLFESLRPTPELSFAVREYGCEAGINVTASHNPKEYNGYKVYWSDGAQLPPQHAAAIARELEHIDIFTGVTSMDFDEAVNKGLITMLGEDCDERFMTNVMSMVNDYETVKKVAGDFKLVYTPFHGCGHKLVPEALTRLGIKHLLCVPEQMVIDGNFPTVVSPNPENPEGFYLAIDLAKKNDVDFILGTDPDSDRVGIMVRNKQGEFEPVTGNQTGVLLLDYLIGAMKRAGKLPANAAALKTIVTTEMARAVAEANGLDCYDTFTGFKFMAEKMNELEGAGKNTVIFSYEESYGYMIGHYLIITDVMMPVMDGFECCRILKEDLKTCHIPIILLTALVGDEDVVKGIELGADDYILKPFNPEILRTKVKRLIKSRVELKQIYTKLLMPSINAIGDIQEENDIAIKIEDPFVTQILKIINDNLQNQEFNVKKLAEMLNMSQPTLYRKVKQLTNFTIIELVRGVRLKRSAELLRTKKYSVQEVAEMVGYNDIPTFRKHFVDFYGTTPSTFNSKEETEDKK